mgnify:CR=1 FL=1
MNRTSDRPSAKSFIDPLIKPLGIKASLELQDDIRHYCDYWTLRGWAIWVLIMVVTIIIIAMWGVMASWGYCYNLTDSDIASLIFIGYSMAMWPVIWSIGYTCIVNRLKYHIRDLAGVEGGKDGNL